MRRFSRRWAQADRKLRLSVCALVFVALAWPATSAWVWIVKGFDPFEQLMLALSWGALGYTATNMILTAKVDNHRGD
ncbi:hypothetical protein KBX53_24590 [Micromonospora sp. M51]|uniref:hypothetical protein n=1 Tax=Micromonospora sp. M51 TaxID=2824889 RepID=UPI001B3818B3|nr:hypothetical protein [Micromonospora sp. M51]MBQ1014066.1 hypothetical protein [Micromonospora sp. M51]